MFKFFKKKKTNGLTTLPAKKLLVPYANLIKQIHQHTGIPDTHWQHVYYQFLLNFASYVQLLPASEAHHHSGQGGLLTHSLETGLNALKMRKGKMLPKGAAAEQIEQEKELWSYAVFTAAMLHDIGKPLTDQNITILDNKSTTQWNPFTGPLPEHSFYQIAFRRGRKYRSHENVALLLAPRILPDPGLEWLSSNIDVLDDWTFCLTGRKSDAQHIGDLVMQADRISTAQNLTGNTNHIPLPSSKAVPLSQRLLSSLRSMLDEKTLLPLNKQGAAGWAYDNHLWFVAKRLLDELKEYMIEKEGQSGIPGDNTRLMDELLQNGILVPNQNNQAVHDIIINIGGQKTWKQDMRVLCISLHKIWDDPDAWPEQPDNIQIAPKKPPPTDDKELPPGKPGSDNTNGTGTNSGEPNNTQPEMEPTKVKEGNPHQGTDGTKEEENKADSSGPFLSDLPLPPGIPVISGGVEINQNQDDQKNEKTQEMKERPSSERPKNAPEKEIPPEERDFYEKPIEKKTNVGQDFMDWIGNGIADGSIPINMTSAPVHTYSENESDAVSLVLVSPRIFRDFQKKQTDKTYKEIQHDFQSLEIHEIAPGDKNMFLFRTKSLRKNNKGSHFSGVIIKDAADKLGIRLPPSNIHIELFKEDKTDN